MVEKGKGAFVVANELKELMLAAPRLTLAVAESLTAGHVQARVAAISGASEFFLGGITAYSLDQKVKHLGVDRAAAKRVKCVSAGVAEQMALGVCILFGADVGVATTGYAEPSPADGIVEPFAWWAVAAGILALSMLVVCVLLAKLAIGLVAGIAFIVAVGLLCFGVGALGAMVGLKIAEPKDS